MKKLKVADVEPRPARVGREIDMQRCAGYLARLGIQLELVPILKHDTEDGRRQCRICLDIQPVDVFAFRRSDRQTRICRPCRDKHKTGWNRGMESAQ
jgi:NAD-dependent dihydropyrimidine dehydrogenase PreA subunit